jgi:tricorn protease
MRVASALLAPLLLSGAAASADDGYTRLLRYPDVSARHIAFGYGGDLWIVGREGGTAMRLTSDRGEELYPKFSPDGQWIAFSAEYAGTRQVYVIAAAGGMPRQLTWYNDVGVMPFRGGTDYRVLDWTPDGQHVVVRMNRLPYDDRGGRPYLVPFAGGMETPLAVPESGGGSLSPDGKRFVYTPIDADWRGWKRYRGGRAPDVWIYDLAANTSTQLTTFRGMDQNPAWVGDSIYYASDASGTLNLTRIAPNGGEPAAVTQFTDFDVLWPSGGPDAVVFEQGGYVWRYDAGAAEAVRVPIRVPADAPAALPRFVKIAPQIESFALAPGAERVAFAARGEIFTVPAKNGEARNVTRTPSERELSVSWSPDGQWLAYLSDASGEYEIYVRRQDGSDAPRRVTRDGDIWRYPPIWSPDGTKLAFADKHVKLRIVDVASGSTSEVDSSIWDDITEYAWSPDSQWLAYTKTNATRMASIWVHSLASGRTVQLTSDRANDSNPAFDPKGRYLYFLSNRDFSGLTFSGYEFNYLYTNPTRIYAATLTADGPALNRPKSDEVAAPASEKPKSKSDAAEDDGPVRVSIDAAGFDARTVALSAPGGQYQGLSANESGVFFLAGNPQQSGFALKYLALDGDKAEEVAAGVSGYALSDKGDKLVLRQGNEFAIVEAKPGQDPSKSKLALDRVELRIDPRAEWQQLYSDAWRILRDWFYDPNLHGSRERWDAIRARYAPLIAHVTTREDLNYVFHEIAGEANAGHVYVERGSSAAPIERKAGGLLGAEFAADESGYFRITRIFPGEAWETANRSPLAEPGVGAKQGEYLIAVDGIDARTVKNVHQLLENKGDRVVELALNARPSAEGARKVLVKTIVNEQNLRYLDWVAERRTIVDRLSEGRIGYFHVPNTATEGNLELNKWFAPLMHKEALIIDDRYNGGGFIPDRMIEILARTPLNYWKRRGLEPQATPFVHHAGPKAMLINGLSSSGGDALPYYFKKLGLGPLIGTRTWGGLIGISGNPSLADGGSILAATFRFMDTDANWAVENEGVAPDIEVIDRPELIAAGRDPSLEKAIEVLLAELAKKPRRKISAPPAPTEFR